MPTFFYFPQRVNVFSFSTSNQIYHSRPRLLLNQYCLLDILKYCLEQSLNSQIIQPHPPNPLP
jgi:hypothetical protein